MLAPRQPRAVRTAKRPEPELQWSSEAANAANASASVKLWFPSPLGSRPAARQPEPLPTTGRTGMSGLLNSGLRPPLVGGLATSRRSAPTLSAPVATPFKTSWRLRSVASRNAASYAVDSLVAMTAIEPSG